MSVPNSETSSSRGRYLRRLEALEDMVEEYKVRCGALEAKCEDFSKWKRAAEDWLYENFEVILDPLAERNVDVLHKVEVEDSQHFGGSVSGQSSNLSETASTEENEEMIEKNDSEVTEVTANTCITGPIESESNNRESTMHPVERQSSSVSRSRSFVLPIPHPNPSTNGMDEELVLQFVKTEQPELDKINITGIRSLNGNSEESVRGQQLPDVETCSPAKTVIADSNEKTVINSGSTSKRNLNEIMLNGKRPSSSNVKHLNGDGKQTPLKSIVLKAGQNSSPSGKDTGFESDVNDSGSRRAHIRISDPIQITMNGEREVKLPNNGFREHERTPGKRKISTIESIDISLEEDGVAFESAATSTKSKGRNEVVKVNINKDTVQPKELQNSEKLEDDDHYDQTPCDVCGAKDPELGNQMVFCEICNVCVHQACYGIRPVPVDKWLCNPCKIGLQTKSLACYFCPKLGGALKPVRSPAKKHWAHVSCTLWIPEVKLQCEQTMEPVINVNGIPDDRWKLKCTLCNIKKGAPIQCQYSKRCTRAFHVTCAMEHGLEMQAVVDDTLFQGCTMFAYCKVHSHCKGKDKDGKGGRKSGSPRKKRRTVL